MPFSMKNTRATYQWMVNKVFKHQIGKNMKTYMNDLLVKSMTFKQHMRDSKEIFFCYEQLSDEVESSQICIYHQ